MNLKDKTPEELKEIISAGRSASEELNSRYRARAEATEARINSVMVGDNEIAFNDDELIYAAGQRCSCGAGYAYPTNIGPRGSWHCSRILKGQAEPGSRHDGALPFTFWEIRSENQPSANGQTTRPQEVDA